MFDVQFANKEYLFLLLLIPVFAVMFMLYIHRRRKNLKKMPNLMKNKFLFSIA